MWFSNDVVRTLYRTEFRMLLRDRRTIIISLILPLAVMPILMFGSHWVTQRREKKLEVTEFTYAVTGPRQELARELIETSLTLSREDQERTPLFLKEVTVDSASDSLACGQLDFYVEATSVETSMPDSIATDTLRSVNTEKLAELPPETPGMPLMRLYFRGDRHRSERAILKLRNALNETRRQQQFAMLEDRGFVISPQNIASLDEHDVASVRQVAGLRIGRFAVLFFLLFIMSGGSVVATDSFAGEKERGTLETLLTTAATRAEIVTAKHLVILTVAVTIAVIQSVNLLAYVAFKLIPLPEGMVLELAPGAVFLVLLFLLPVAALVAGVLLLTSGYAKSYKEAQLYFFPVFLLGMIPALASFLPGIALRSAIVVVPVSNVAVAVKEMLVGIFDWPMLIVAFVSTALAAGYVSRLAERTLSTERLIVPGGGKIAESRMGPELFPRHVLPAFAIMWALLIILSTNIQGHVDLRIQLLINLVVLFLGGSLLIMRRYRLDAHQVLALRPVRPIVWLLVLVGVPSGLLAATGVFRLVNLVLPVPPEMLEALSRALFPSEIPKWQLLFFVAILPGVCEEIAFRGVLLHGLRRQLHPAALVIVVGIIFGVFHVSLFRIAPTAFLGFILASITMLTGSIFPAMMWHALNNAAGILFSDMAAKIPELDAGSHLAGGVALILVFYLLWRNRSPYPDLLPWRR